MAHTCLEQIESFGLAGANLDLDEFFETPLSQKRPLLSYAMLHWMTHTKYSSQTAKYVLEDHKSFFTKSSSERDSWWLTYRTKTKHDFLLKKVKGAMHPLNMACYLGIAPWIRMLLDKMNWMNRTFKLKQSYWLNRGLKPVHFAAYQGEEESLCLLLKGGADINAKDKDGETALSYATYSGHESTAQLLLKWGRRR